MFNFLVAASEDDWTGRPFVYPGSRVLEFTDSELKARFSSLNEAAIATLTQIPALFAYEEGVGQSARVGRITSIQTRGGDVRIAYDIDPNIAPIWESHLVDMSWDLSIEGREWGRSHWALKKGDLLQIIEDYRSKNGESPRVRSLHRFSRGLLLAACDMLQAIGHTPFDRFLLQIGIPEIDADRSKGGLMDRATALGKFVVAHQDMMTAEDRPLGLVVVEKAAQIDPRYPDGGLYNGDDRVRKAFWNGLQKEGFRLQDDTIVQGQVATSPPPETIKSIFKRTAAEKPMPTPMTKPKVFLVHGRDGGSKQEVARFIEKLDLDVVILHEQPNTGRSLIAKFMEEAAGSDFAVVLVTADDEGGIVGGPMSPRGRQNVIFELGYFIGKLGPSRVCALMSDGVERPSDFEAVVYVPFGENTPWRFELARELRAAGISFDPSRAF